MWEFFYEFTIVLLDILTELIETFYQNPCQLFDEMSLFKFEIKLIWIQIRDKIYDI